MSKNNTQAAALRSFADGLRSRGGLDCATAKVATPSHHGEVYEWRDYVRGKDLLKHLRSQQELLDTHTKPQAAGRGQDDQVSDLVALLVHKYKLLAPAERKFKKPKPGKKKLVKWPRTLDPAPDTPLTSEELFFAFTYERPMGWGLYVGAGLVVLAVLAATLFPLAPHPVRLAVLYFLSGLLCLILGTMALRYLLWSLVWMATGAHFWLFPNMMSETVPVTQLFSPAISYDTAAPGDKSSSLLLRGGAAALLAGGGYVLWAKGPDAATVGSNLRGAKDSVLNYFDLMEDMRVGITNGTNTTGIMLNKTANGSSEGEGGQQQEQGGEQPAAADAAAGEEADAAGQEAAGPESDWDPTLDSDAEL